MWFGGGSSAGTQMEAHTGLGRGLCPFPEPPPQKNFGIFSFEIVHFDAFWKTFRSTVILSL